MLTSKEIIERTGISRATLNNYIASGLVPRPEVVQPRPEDGAAPRIGYFPEDTVERIEVIQRLKREGWSMDRISEHFANPASQVAKPVQEAPSQPARAAPAKPEVSAAQTTRPVPSLTTVAILVATLEDAPGLWVKLSAQEYFELVDEVWSELDTVFRRHGGRAGRHPDEGLVCYFVASGQVNHLWSAVAAACDTRRAMQHVSGRWQARKGWDVALAMNTGLDEGREWMGATGAGALRVLGEAAERAEQLSRCSRAGGIVVTRTFIGKLSAQERSRIVFGVRRPGAGGDAPLLSTFTRLGDLCVTAPVPPHMSVLAVTEILDLQELPGERP